jgi:hypothetical protein
MAYRDSFTFLFSYYYTPEDGIRMDLREIGLGGCGLDSTVSGQGPVACCCECGDEPSGSCATELVITIHQDVGDKGC